MTWVGRLPRRSGSSLFGSSLCFETTVNELLRLRAFGFVTRYNINQEIKMIRFRQRFCNVCFGNGASFVSVCDEKRAARDLLDKYFAGFAEQYGSI